MHRVFLAFVVVACLCLGLNRMPVHAQSTFQAQGAVVSAGSVGPGGAKSVVVAWPVNFADTDYAVSCTLLEDDVVPSAAVMFVRNIRAVSVSSVTAIVYNPLVAGSGVIHSGTVHCVGVHN